MILKLKNVKHCHNLNKKLFKIISNFFKASCNTLLSEIIHLQTPLKPCEFAKENLIVSYCDLPEDYKVE